MKLLPFWRRKLTHGYSAWATFGAIVLIAIGNLPFVISEFIPWWASIGLLLVGLAGALIKQETVSGAAE